MNPKTFFLKWINGFYISSSIEKKKSARRNHRNPIKQRKLNKLKFVKPEAVKILQAKRLRLNLFVRVSVSPFPWSGRFGLSLPLQGKERKETLGMSLVLGLWEWRVSFPVALMKWNFVSPVETISLYTDCNIWKKWDYRIFEGGVSNTSTYSPSFVSLRRLLRLHSVNSKSSVIFIRYEPGSRFVRFL